MLGIDEREFEEISIAMISISLAILIADIGITGLFKYSIVEIAKQMGVLIIAVGAGFVLHELAHKYVAQMYGAVARFRMWTTGLVMMFVFAILLGVIFAAPGAVYIYAPFIRKRENGIISVAGPLTNIALSLIFLSILPFAVMQFGPKSIISEIALIGYSVNGILALFNMLPVFPLDGSKVLNWNWVVWLIVTGLAALVYLGPMMFLL